MGRLTCTQAHFILSQEVEMFLLLTHRWMGKLRPKEQEDQLEVAYRRVVYLVLLHLLFWVCVRAPLRHPFPRELAPLADVASEPLPCCCLCLEYLSLRPSPGWFLPVIWTTGQMSPPQRKLPRPHLVPRLSAACFISSRALITI